MCATYPLRVQPCTRGWLCTCPCYLEAGRVRIQRQSRGRHAGLSQIGRKGEEGKVHTFGGTLVCGVVWMMSVRTAHTFGGTLVCGVVWMMSVRTALQTE